MPSASSRSVGAAGSASATIAGKSWIPDEVFVSDQVFPVLTPQGGILPGADGLDLAVVRFGAGAGAAAGVVQYPKLAATLPAVGTPVTLVGFGLTDANDQGSNPTVAKHFGHNEVATVAHDVIGIVGPCAASTTTTVSATAPGDSGGPLVTGDYPVLGVVSSGLCKNGSMSSKYTAVTDAYAKSLLARAGIPAP